MTNKMTEITATERRELRRIIRDRFELLELQIDQRSAELREMIRERIEARYAKDLLAAEAESAVIIGQAEDLLSKASEIEEKYRERGIVPGEIETYTENYKHGRRVKKRKRNYGISTDLFSFEASSGWFPAEIEEETDREFNKLMQEAGDATINLKRQRLELEEELAMDAVQSDAARSFLGRIPTVEQLLPMEDDVKQLL